MFNSIFPCSLPGANLGGQGGYIQTLEWVSGGQRENDGVSECVLVAIPLLHIS